MANTASNSTAAEFARELTQATRSGVNLSEALLAAADAAHSRRLASSLREVAERVNRGELLDQILAKDTQLPPHLAGLLRASLATGQPALAIAEWLFARERARAHWNSVMATLHYPLATLIGTYLLFVFLSMWLIPELTDLLDDFNLNLPDAYRAMYWFAQQGAPASLWALGIIAAALVVLRIVGGAAVWSQFMSAVPLIGPLWHWSSSSELYRVLAILLDRRIPLPQALQLAGDGISDAAVANHCRKLAAQVGQGSALAAALQVSPELPPSTFPLIRSGEKAGTLADSLRTAAELLESRLQSQSATILHLAPTVIFLLILGMAFMMVAGFMIPLISLIRGLT